MLSQDGYSLKSFARRNARNGLVPGTLQPGDLAHRYGLDALYRQGGYGRGERIGLLELADPSPADDATYWQQFSANATLNRPVRVVEVGRPTHDPGSSAETDLDLQVAGALAPGAQLVAYSLDARARGGAFLGQVYDALEQAGRDGIGIVSISLGISEALFAGCSGVASRLTGEQWTNVLDFATALDALIERHALAVFASAGDSGAYGGQPFGDNRPQPIWPAIQPGVISCGGTQLSRPGALDAQEAAWGGQTVDSALPGYSPANTLAQASGGGGVSTVIPAPPYQAALGYPGRATPDLAAFAGPLVVLEGGAYLSVWGTSASAPVAAAIAALVHEATGRRLEHTWLYPRLHDVIQGNNWNSQLLLMGLDAFYNAQAGYDLCTGAGTPAVEGLIGC